MAKLGASDQSVPGIEVADLNDGDIISATRKLSEDGGKTIVFAYTLPNGQELKSDPVLAEHVGKAIFGWLDAVKMSIVEAAQPEVDESALRAQRDRDWQTDGVRPVASATDDDVLGVVQGGRIPGTKPSTEPVTAGPNPDPKAFIKAQIAEAKATAAILTKQISQRQKALVQITRQLDDWQRALTALTMAPPKAKRARK